MGQLTSERCKSFGMSNIKNPPQEIAKKGLAEESQEWSALLESSRRRLEASRNAMSHVFVSHTHPKPDEDSDSSLIPNFLESFFESLSGNESQKPSSKELQTMRGLFDSILELRKQNILNEDEVNALAIFLATRLVEKRFDKIIHYMLPLRKAHSWFLSARHKINK
jgi:hypothetical protein